MGTPRPWSRDQWSAPPARTCPKEPFTYRLTLLGVAHPLFSWFFLDERLLEGTVSRWRGDTPVDGSLDVKSLDVCFLATRPGT